MFKKKFYVLLSIMALLFLTACNNKAEEKSYEGVKQEEIVKSADETIAYYKVDSNNTAIVQFSKVFENPNELQSKIKITPKTEVETIFLGGDKLLIRGDFESNIEYHCDLSAITGDKNDIIDLTFEDKPESITFEEQGIVLPQEEKSLALKTINVERVDVEIYRIFPNNANSFVNSFDFTQGGKYSYRLDSRLDELGEVVYDAKTEVVGEKNKANFVNIEFGKAFEKNGIYAIEVQGKPIGKDYSYRARAKKVIIISDIGIMAKKLPDYMDVQLVDIKTRNPIKNAKVYLMSKNNQTLQALTSDKEGRARFYGALDKGYYIKAVKGEDINVLKLTHQLPLGSFDVDGVVSNNQIYVNVDRPEYRPGDEIHANIIVRQDGKPLDEGHPIKVTWFDTNHNKEEITLEWNENSFYSIDRKIPKRAVTGLWGLQVEVGDRSEYIKIPVETSIAQKLTSTLKAPKKVDCDFLGSYELSLESHYLYGDPSPNQIIDGKAIFVPVKKRFLNYENFTFQLPNEKFKKEYPFQIDLVDGKYQGEVTLVPEEARDTEQLSTSWNMKLYWEVNVLDENGRPNKTYAVTKLDKYKTFVGIENCNGKYVTVGNTKKLPVVILDKKGNRVGGHKLKYTIYKKSSLFWYDFYKESKNLSLKNDRTAEKIKEGELVSSSDENSYIIVPELSEGTVYIEVEDTETNQKTGTSYRLSYWEENSKFQEVSKLRMNSDKKEYEVGDVATIIWEANKGAKAYVSLEKEGKVFKRFVMDIPKNEGKINLKITEDMIPNVYVNVVLLQDYEKYNNDRPARLYGILPIVVKDTEHRAEINVDVPEKVESKDNLVINISNKANKEMEYVVSVIDLGLLQKQNYKLPDPHGYFFAKRAYEGKLYDNYTILLAKNQIKADTILEVGGGDFVATENKAAAIVGAMDKEIEDKMLGLENAVRFKNLALYKGIVKSDEEGNAKVEFKLPRYQGAVKVIVTGVSKDSYGSANKDVVVSAPVIMLNSAPRALKIGDSFTVTSKLVQKNPDIKKGNLTIKFEDNEIEVPVDFTKQDEYLIKQLFTVKNEIGTKEIKVSFVSDNYSDEEIIPIDVNSINPYTYKSDVFVIEPGKTEIVPVVDDYIKGSGSSSIAVSTTERYGIDRRLAELINYPYGCSEQITSIALAQLYLRELETNKIENEEKVTDNVNETLMKLRNYETEKGFSYWEYSNVSSPFSWLDNYIGEFIVRAREQGYYVNQEFYNKVINLLQRNSVQNEDMSQKVYALWILSNIQQANMSELNYVRESMYESLDLTDKWLLLSAYSKEGENSFARKRAKDLIVFDKGKTPREIALRAEAYRSIYGNLPKETEDKLITLLSGLDSYDTYSIARILMALVESPEKVLDSSFELNDKTMTTENGLYNKEYDPKEQITIKNTGDKDLYVYTFFEGKTLASNEEDVEQGILIERSDLPEKSKRGEELSWMLLVSKGDKAGVNYLEKVAVVETLPSSWEWELDRKYLESLGVEYVDIRDDRVILVFPYIGDKEVEIRLKARAITEGKYIFPGAQAEEMYHSRVRGQVKDRIIEVVE